MTVEHRSKRSMIVVQRSDDPEERDFVWRFGPDRLSSALVLTFDNLGEASELERGTWPAGKALGRHPSVTDVLPRLLDTLDAHELQATFFVEAVNCELYPHALLEIVRRGHEVGHHGWRHEAWAGLTATQERDALTRGMQAFSALGLQVTGFRPPGGELTGRSPALLRDAGLRWCSPAGGPSDVRDGLAYVPFEWPLVDAYHLMERFDALRRRRGDPAGVVHPDRLADQLAAELAALRTREGQRTLILHPFLMVDEAWFAGVQRLLGMLAELAQQRRSWVVPGGRFAAWLRGSPGE
jgi:peptidoglycan/xylan/chitin deacetylase (PgdA/CDA1 family)